jgi:pimeloyl-ACP methyl ester carboxylesterase
LDTTVPFVVDRQQKELQYRGFIPSVLASLRGALANDTKADHQRIAYHDLDVHAIWGADDVVIPLFAKDQLEVWNPKVRHHVIDGAGHGVTYTHTDAMMTAFD